MYIEHGCDDLTIR